MVLDPEAEHPSRWAAVSSIAAKIGCSLATLQEWDKRNEVDSGKRACLPSDLAEKKKDLEEESYAKLDAPAMAA
jgi:transposase